MDIMLTRAMVTAAIDGSLKDVEYKQDEVFKVWVPTTSPGVDDATILFPVNTWDNKDAYRERALKLAGDFAASQRARLPSRCVWAPDAGSVFSTAGRSVV